MTEQELEALRERLKIERYLGVADSERLFQEIAQLLRHNQCLADELNDCREKSGAEPEPQKVVSVPLLNPERPRERLVVCGKHDAFRGYAVCVHVLGGAEATFFSEATRTKCGSIGCAECFARLDDVKADELR